MIIPIQDFMNNVYHYIKQTLEYDIFTKVGTQNGNIVIMSEEKFNCLIENFNNTKRD